EDTPSTPFNPFEKAAVGDWVAFKTTFKSGEHENKNANLLEVTKIEEDTVYITSSRGGSVKKFSTKKPPTILEFMGGPPSAKVEDLTTKDEKKTLGGKEFDCKVVSFKMTGRDAIEATYVFCPEMKVTGFFSLTNTSTKKNKSSMQLEVVAFGTKE